MDPQTPLQPNQDVNPPAAPVPPQPSVVQPQQPIMPTQPSNPTPVLPQQPTVVAPSGIVVGGGGGSFTGSVDSGATSVGEKSFMVTFLLALLLGGIGADRYYLGKIGTGLLKMFTFGGFLIWATIDLILLLAGKTKDKQGNALSGYESNRKTAFIIFAVVMIVNVLSVSFVVYTITQATKEVVKTVSETVKDVAKECSGGACATDPAPTKFKDSVSAGGFNIHILTAQADPKTSGDPVDAGMQYVSVMLLIENPQSSSASVPGMFYYKTPDGKLFNDASTVSGGPTDSAKNVQLADDPAMLNLAGASSIDANAADASHYLIFHVPKGELGQLVWFEEPLDTASTKLAIFDLK